MSFWSDWFARAKLEPPQRAAENVTPQANEPDVFECRDCGKVFESPRLPVACPECDSTNVERMT